MQQLKINFHFVLVEDQVVKQITPREISSVSKLLSSQNYAKESVQIPFGMIDLNFSKGGTSLKINESQQQQQLQMKYCSPLKVRQFIFLGQEDDLYNLPSSQVISVNHQEKTHQQNISVKHIFDQFPPKTQPKRKFFKIFKNQQILSPQNEQNNVQNDNHDNKILDVKISDSKNRSSHSSLTQNQLSPVKQRKTVWDITKWNDITPQPSSNLSQELKTPEINNNIMQSHQYDEQHKQQQQQLEQGLIFSNMKGRKFTKKVKDEYKTKLQKSLLFKNNQDSQQVLNEVVHSSKSAQPTFKSKSVGNSFVYQAERPRKIKTANLNQNGEKEASMFEQLQEICKSHSRKSSTGTQTKRKKRNRNSDEITILDQETQKSLNQQSDLSKSQRIERKQETNSNSIKNSKEDAFDVLKLCSNFLRKKEKRISSIQHFNDKVQGTPMNSYSVNTSSGQFSISPLRKAHDSYSQIYSSQVSNDKNKSSKGMSSFSDINPKFKTPSLMRLKQNSSQERNLESRQQVPQLKVTCLDESVSFLHSQLKSSPLRYSNRQRASPRSVSNLFSLSERKRDQVWLEQATIILDNSQMLQQQKQFQDQQTQITDEDRTYSPLAFTPVQTSEQQNQESSSNHLVRLDCCYIRKKLNDDSYNKYKVDLSLSGHRAKVLAQSYSQADAINEYEQRLLGIHKLQQSLQNIENPKKKKLSEDIGDIQPWNNYEPLDEEACFGNSDIFNNQY